MNTFSHVPPGFRFHPTDEELVDYYLRKKIASKKIDLDVIRDVDLYKIEPWDLQELCRLGNDDQNEWYFFSYKDKKYPTGTRTNRATKAGFWKATGRDKAIYLKHSLIGMRKTLVFYKGRAPNGQKSDWIMHEYRLETNENGSALQEEGWAVCKVFKKRMTMTMRKHGDYHQDSMCWYDDRMPSSFMPADLDSPRQIPHHHPYNNNFPYPCKQEQIDQYLHGNKLQQQVFHHDNYNSFLQLPQLESPKIPQVQQQPGILMNSMIHCGSNPGPYGSFDINGSFNMENSVFSCQEKNGASSDVVMMGEQAEDDQVTDWRVLDKFVASQLSQGDDHDHDQAVSKELTYNSADHVAGETVSVAVDSQSSKQHVETEYGSNSECPPDLWKC